MKTGLHQVKSVNDQLILSLDGNFQHRHQKAAGQNYSPLITPDIFVQPRDLDEMKQYIKAQEALHKVPKKVCESFSPERLCVDANYEILINIEG
jgi:hypothetical protein